VPLLLGASRGASLVDGDEVVNVDIKRGKRTKKRDSANHKIHADFLTVHARRLFFTTPECIFAFLPAPPQGE